MELIKKKQKYIYLLITRHISVNNNLTLSVSFGYPGGLSYQTIAISMMMSMAIVLQIFLGCVVICIRHILKLKSQADLRKSPYGYFIEQQFPVPGRCPSSLHQRFHSLTGYQSLHRFHLHFQVYFPGTNYQSCHLRLLEPYPKGPL